MRFVLVDRLIRVEAAERLVAETTFDPSEELFLDHFPGRPLVPGTLLTEAMAQAGGWLILLGSEFLVWPLLALVERAKFRRPVRPGTLLTLEASRAPDAPAPRPGSTCRVEGEARAGGRVVASASCIYQLFEPAAIGLRGTEHTEWLARTYRKLVEGCDGCPPLRGLS